VSITFDVLAVVDVLCSLLALAHPDADLILASVKVLNRFKG
jgi:hypothetical protein